MAPIAKKKAVDTAPPAKSAGGASPVAVKKPAPAAKKPSSEMYDELMKLDTSAMLLGKADASIRVRGIISTQVPTIDYAIGRGGVPTARLTILHGGEGSGKTTLALHLVAEVQRLGGKAWYIDKEHKLDLEYAKKIGVNVDEMYYSTPNHLEGAFEVMAGVIKVFAKYADAKMDVPHIIILDSMNAAISKAEFEGEWEDQHMAPQARVFSRLLPKLIPLVSKSNVALVWISQVRQKMNVTYGDADEIAGGKSARFYASLIIDVKKIGKAKSGEEAVGSKVKIACKKNQIAMPFKEAEVEINYGRGFDKPRALIEIAEGHGIIEKTGNTYSYGERKLGVGLPNAVEALEKDQDLYDEINAKIRTALKW